MLMFKSLINYLISKTSGNLFCLLRTFFEKILMDQKEHFILKKVNILENLINSKKQFISQTKKDQDYTVKVTNIG